MYNVCQKIKDPFQEELIKPNFVNGSYTHSLVVLSVTNVLYFQFETYYFANEQIFLTLKMSIFMILWFMSTTS